MVAALLWLWLSAVKRNQIESALGYVHANLARKAHKGLP
jgi:hypothetical protein